VTSGQERPRVLVADADEPTRTGLQRALRRGGLEIAGVAVDAGAAVGMAAAERPDLAVVAAELPGGGIDAVRQIAARVARVRLVLLTGRPSGDELVEAVRAGAVGYLGRDVSSARLPEILRAVIAGEVALPRRHSQHLVEALRHEDAMRSELAARTDVRLTDREWEVLQMLAEGVTTGEISRRLRISAVTARRHISSLMAKLGVADRAGAVELLRRRSRT
jgi:DNA-binding NarL/FixJ family response regulator